jgi:hypothetical protein
MKSMSGGMGRQRGVALAIGLLLLLVLTVIGIGAMRSSVLEYQMARNEESRISSFQRAQSLIDAAIDDTDNLVVSGSVGDVICLAKDVGVNNCTSTNGTVQLSGNLIAAPYDTRSSVFIKRFGPLPDGLVPAPRGLGFSVDFKAAQFEVGSTYDATGVKQGRSSLAQGVMIIISAAQ